MRIKQTIVLASLVVALLFPACRFVKNRTEKGNAACPEDIAVSRILDYPGGTIHTAPSYADWMVLEMKDFRDGTSVEIAATSSNDNLNCHLFYFCLEDDYEIVIGCDEPIDSYAQLEFQFDERKKLPRLRGIVAPDWGDAFVVPETHRKVITANAQNSNRMHLRMVNEGGDAITLEFSLCGMKEATAVLGCVRGPTE